MNRTLETAVDDGDHDTITRIEQQLVDVVVRHALDPVDVPLTAFTDWTCNRIWTAVQTLWNRQASPTIEAVVGELEQAMLPTSACTAADVLFLAQGYRRDVDDYTAVLLANDRRRRLAILLGDASQSIAAGADPDAVLTRILEQAS